MTLLDFPGRVACTVFLGGCDFRCPYCHNFELVTGEAKPLMDDEELFAFLEKRHGLLDGVAITGGEPCMNPGLPDLLRRIREMGFMTKLDTNGYHPEVLEKILEEGLVDYVAMDIKNSPEKYAETVGLVSDIQNAGLRKKCLLTFISTKKSVPQNEQQDVHGEDTMDFSLIPINTHMGSGS